MSLQQSYLPSSHQYHQQLYQSYTKNNGTYPYTQIKLDMPSTGSYHEQLINNYEKSTPGKNLSRYRQYGDQKSREETIKRELEFQKYNRESLGNIDRLNREKMSLLRERQIQNLQNKQNLLSQIINKSASTRKRRKYSCDHDISAQKENNNENGQETRHRLQKILQQKYEIAGIGSKNKERPSLQEINNAKQGQVIKYSPQFIYNDKLVDQIKQRWLCSPDKNSNVNEYQNYIFNKQKNQSNEEIKDSRFEFLQNYEMGSHRSTCTQPVYPQMKLSSVGEEYPLESNHKHNKSILKNSKYSHQYQKSGDFMDYLNNTYTSKGSKRSKKSKRQRSSSSSRRGVSEGKRRKSVSFVSQNKAEAKTKRRNSIGSKGSLDFRKRNRSRSPRPLSNKSRKQDPFSKYQNALDKIQKRIQLSDYIFEDSQFRNCLHEKVHLKNTHAKEVIERKQLLDKVCFAVQDKARRNRMEKVCRNI